MPFLSFSASALRRHLPTIAVLTIFFSLFLYGLYLTYIHLILPDSLSELSSPPTLKDEIIREAVARSMTPDTSSEFISVSDPLDPPVGFSSERQSPLVPRPQGN